MRAPRDPATLDRFEAATGRTMTTLALAIVPIYVAQALADDASAWVTRPLMITRTGIQAAMAVDVIIRTHLSPHRLSFLADHKLEVAAILLPPLRTAKEVVGLRSIVSRPGVARFTSVTVAVIIACALVVYGAEHDHPGASIDSLGDALWWAVVTTTTVGYGDEVPVTDEGRLVAVVLMCMGLALLAVLTAHIAAHFVDDDRHEPDALDRVRHLEARLASIESHLEQIALSTTHRLSAVREQEDPS